jgi:cytochrome o ubiquinol oxidase subunit 2
MHKSNAVSGEMTSSDSWRRDEAQDHIALVKRVLCYVVLAMLSGCSMQLFNPKGDIGEQEKTLIIVALGLMLLVVIPVIALTLYFAWRYRASNTAATYAPKWAHSTPIEIVVWSIPCIIVAILAVLIWKTTHSLDPYQPIKSQAPPVRVEVVALNWKWLFIYPDYGVASVNKLEIPVDTPVEFKLTAESIMNSFFIPQLGSQVYAMPGMQTKLHLIANHPGTYRGLSTAYSGEGFSDMHFQTVAASRKDFDNWIAQARKSPLKLDKPAYAVLQQDSHGYPVTEYGGFEPGLFNGIVNKYMHPAPTQGTHSHEAPMPSMAMHHMTTPAVE